MKRTHKQLKCFDWYGIRQRFSIRKYHFGVASVLLGTAFVLGNGFTASADRLIETGSSVFLSADESNRVVEAKPAEVANNVTATIGGILRNNALPKPKNEGEAIPTSIFFRANVVATEGPTNANKVGYNNNPQNGVFEDGSSFETEDMSGAQEMSYIVENQINASGQNGKSLGRIKYNWKEKETTTADGWTVKNADRTVKVIEVLPPTEYSQDRDSSQVRPSKTYNKPLREPSPGVPKNNNASGFNEKQVPGAFEGSKYLELVNKGTIIQKEYDVNQNSQILFSVTHTGAYGGYNSPGEAEKIKLRVYDAATNRPIITIRDSVGGEEAEVHAGPVADPLEDGTYTVFTGTNTTGWKRTGRIYAIPSNVSRIRVEIEAGDPGDMLPEGNDGYLIDNISMVTLPGIEIKTDVKSGTTGAFGENRPYKKSQEGTFLVTINNVGALDVYQAHGFTTTVHVPEGVELPAYLQNPEPKWHWLGSTPANGVKYDKQKRQLTFTILPGAIKPGENGSRTVAIPFIAKDDYKGEATLTANTTFHIGGKNINNVDVLARNGWLNRYGNLVFKDNQASDDPNYVYKKTIYVDSIVPAAPIVEPIHTDGITGEDAALNQPRTIKVIPPILDAKSNDLASMEITFPGSIKVGLTQKEDGWYNGENKIGDLNSPLIVSVPENVTLDEGENVITATVKDKTGNVSEPAKGNVLNSVPEVLVGKPYTLIESSTEQITDVQLLDFGKVTATDLEDDRDGVEGTKPTIAIVDRGGFAPDKPGKYIITVQSTDSETKTSLTKTFEIEVVDPTELTKEITRTINYKFEDGTAVPNHPSVKQTVTYTRAIKEDGTGLTEWESDKKKFDKIDSPEVQGYIPDKTFISESPELLPTASDVIVDVTYKKDDQRATVTFINKKTETIIAIITETGKTGENFEKANEVETKLAELEKKGYTLEDPARDNNYPTGEARKFDTDKTLDQEYTIKLVEKVIPVPATPPLPDQPVDPKNPNSPVWPSTVADVVTTKEVTRTVTYVKNENKTESPTEIPNVTDKVPFERTANINLVSGAITYSEWTAKDGDTTFDAVNTKVLNGYVADKATVPSFENVTATTDNVIEKVTYKPIGKYVPKVPEGFTEPTLPTYINNPNDPTGVLPPEELIPYVPGTTPVGLEGPLVPEDPKNPTKGYKPPTPIAGDLDTPIFYIEKGDQIAVINYVEEVYSDQGEKIEKVLVSESVIGKTGKDITFDISTTLTDLEKRGYEIVSNEYKEATDEAKKFDDDTTVVQKFKVLVQPKLIEVDPDDPKVPGTPIDPNNPDGSKWPEGVQELDLKRTIKREVEYVKNENGKEIPLEIKDDEVIFTRKAIVNAVTGQVIYSMWKAVNDDTTFDEIKTPVLEGYLADKDSVPEVSNLTIDSYKNTNHILKEKVTYKPIGSSVPINPDTGNPPAPNQPNPNPTPDAETPSAPNQPDSNPTPGTENPPTDVIIQPIKPADPSKPTAKPINPEEKSTSGKVDQRPILPKTGEVTLNPTYGVASLFVASLLAFIGVKQSKKEDQ